MSEKSPLPASLLETIPWIDEPQAIWISSLITLHRNLGQYKFPSKMEKHELEQVTQILTKNLGSISQLQNLTVLPESEVSPSDRELFFEHFLSLYDLSTAPDGGVFAIDEKGQFLGSLNVGDHLVMRALSIGSNWDEAWKLICQADNQIAQDHPFAFSPKFGYLTSDPAQCGTGLVVNAYLHIPALIHTNQLDEALSNCEEEEIHFMSLVGNLQETYGDILVVQNTYTVGKNEEAILSGVQSAATKLIGAEKALRSHLEQERPTDIKDLIAKSFGLLVHSYKLETAEALDLLSIMKLGLSLGMVRAVDDKKLSELIFKCRRGHLSHFYPDVADPMQLAHHRAELLHKELAGIELSDDLH